MSLLDPIPVYIINLKRSPERAEAALAECYRAGLSGATIWQGVDGHKWTLATSNAFSPVECINSSKIALCLTYWHLWQHLKILGKEAVIFEDDVVLCPDFLTELEQSRAKCPSDWQMLYIGGCHCAGLKTLNSRIARGIPWCTHAILYHPSAYQPLMDNCEEAKRPIDLEIAATCQGMKIYACQPFLVEQRTLRGEWESQVGSE